MAQSAQLRMDNGLEAFYHWASELGNGGLKKIHSQAAWNLAQKVKSLVQRQYRSYDDSPSRSGFGYLSTTLGKDWGKENFAIAPMSPPGMGIFADNVQAEPTADRTGYNIFINPTAKHPRSGKPLAEIATYLEDPPVQNIPITLRSMVYHKLIMAGKGGYNTKTTGRFIENNKVIGTLVLQPKAKPVWSVVSRRMIPREIRGQYSRDVSRRIAAIAKKYKSGGFRSI